MLNVDNLRSNIIRNCLFPKRDLPSAIQQMGFIQADPIRSPARAQDLILRHRVNQYQVGDLEKEYPRLALEEAYLFAYGFLPRKDWQLIYPKPDQNLTLIQKRTLEWVTKNGPSNPKSLETEFGKKRIKNYWGGYSNESKKTLEQLHDLGYLRVSSRDKGLRVYDLASTVDSILSPTERYQQILIKMVKLKGPTSSTFLLSETKHFNYLLKTTTQRKNALNELIQNGQLNRSTIDAIPYFHLPITENEHTADSSLKILAPFDPIVRDRHRFEHIWNWAYRFEAYTPLAKRKLGYYAMPILWRENIIGWANAKVESERLKVQFGYQSKQPKSKSFRNAVEEEISQMATFLHLNPAAWEWTEIQ